MRIRRSDRQGETQRCQLLQITALMSCDEKSGTQHAMHCSQAFFFRVRASYGVKLLAISGSKFPHMSREFPTYGNIQDNAECYAGLSAHSTACRNSTKYCSGQNVVVQFFSGKSVLMVQVHVVRSSAWYMHDTPSVFSESERSESHMLSLLPPFAVA